MTCELIEISKNEYNNASIHLDNELKGIIENTSVVQVIYKRLLKLLGLGE